QRAAARTPGKRTRSAVDTWIAGGAQPRMLSAAGCPCVCALLDAGVPVGVNYALMIPSVSVPDPERVHAARSHAGVASPCYIALRLP
ncbi:hypothetical protein OIV42_31790, partial [Burkholderia pseudomallei]|nr:hypothetical protein [Burkholderia pseudomallei]